MIWSDENADPMGNDQSHKSDDSADSDRGSSQECRYDQKYLSYAVNSAAKRLSCVITENE